MSIASTQLWTTTQAVPRSAAAPTVARAPQTVRTFLWALFLLVVAEGTLRIRAGLRQGSFGPVADIYEADSTLGRRPRPGATLGGTDRRLSINRSGFRGPEVAQPKPPGTLRIAALGDSTTFGMEAASDAAVWVEQLTAELNANGTRRFDSMNAAVPGYTLAMSLERLRRDVAPFDPDIIIVLQTTTEIAAHSRRQFRVVIDPDPVATSLAKLVESQSLLINLVKQNAAPLLARFVPTRRHDRLDDRGLAEFTARLAELDDLCRQQGWPLVLCTTPRSFGDPSASEDQFALASSALANNPALSLVGLNDGFDRYNEGLRSFARDRGLTLVDLARSIPKGSTYFVDATHLNDAGHRRVAERIREALTVREVEP